MDSHVREVAANRPTRMGCNTLTPSWVAKIPVTMGNTDPPICPITKTRAKAVEWMAGGNSFEATETPYCGG